jgi:hypothetical protein
MDGKPSLLADASPRQKWKKAKTLSYPQISVTALHYIYIFYFSSSSSADFCRFLPLPIVIKPPFQNYYNTLIFITALHYLQPAKRPAKIGKSPCLDVIDVLH